MSLSAKELALYFDCYLYITVTDEIVRMKGIKLISKNVIEIITEDGFIRPKLDEIKPILRPLFDMNNDEMDEVKNAHHMSGVKELKTGLEIPREEGVPVGYVRYKQFGNLVTYLIDRRFDVFDWILEEKAISALELEQNPYRDE